VNGKRAQAIEAEVAELLAQYAGQTVDGNRAVARNGHLREREIQIGLGEVPVKLPKVRDRSGAFVQPNKSFHLTAKSRVERSGTALLRSSEFSR
jgi:hypothetical protein